MNRRAKKWITLILAAVLMMVLAVAVSADDHGAVVDSGECGDNLTWVLYKDGLLEISGTGEMWDYDNPSGKKSPWSIYSSQLKSLVLNEEITSIGNYAFCDCDGFTGSLTIPDSVTKIGESAFSHCKGFDGTISLSKNLTSIGGRAFYCCYDFIGKLAIPESVVEIGDSAFGYCGNFDSLFLSEGLTAIGEYAFLGDYFEGVLIIPESTISIGNGAFGNCHNITEFNVSPKNNAYMSYEGGLYTKDGKELLQFPLGKTEIPIFHPSLTVINTYAFFESTLSGQLIIPEGVEKIEDYAFANSNISSVYLPSTLKEMGENPFAPNNNLTAFEVSEENRMYADYAGLLYSKDYTTLIMCPAGLMHISKFHPSLKVIGEDAFDRCSNISGQLIIPEGVQEIESAFVYCWELSSLIIPESVNIINDYAFFSCTKIQSAYFCGDAPTEVSDKAFRSCADDFTIYYLNGTSGWSTPEWNGYPCYPVDAIPEPEPSFERGDVNSDNEIDSNDAIYLLRYTMNQTRYPINQSGDLNGDGEVDSDDAIYLLRHTMNPSRYPLS